MAETSPLKAIKTELEILRTAVKMVAEPLLDASAQMTSLRSSLLVVTASTQQASAEFNFVYETAQRLGIELGTLTGAYTRLAAGAAAAGVPVEETHRIFLAFAEAGKAAGFQAEEMNSIFNTLGQMLMSGGLKADELRKQIGERLPIAYQLAAQAMGMTTRELELAIDNGVVLAKDVLPHLASAVQAQFAETVPHAVSETDASIKRLGNSWLAFRDTVANSGFNTGVKIFSEGWSEVLDNLKKKISENAESIRKIWPAIFGLGSPAVARLYERAFAEEKPPQPKAATTAGAAAVNPPVPVPSAADNAQYAAVADFVKRAPKLKETKRKYDEARFEDMAPADRIAAMEIQINELRADQLKPVSFKGVAEALQKPAALGWVQKGVEEDLEILNLQKKIKAEKEKIQQLDAHARAQIESSLDAELKLTLEKSKQGSIAEQIRVKEDAIALIKTNVLGVDKEGGLEILRIQKEISDLKDKDAAQKLRDGDLTEQRVRSASLAGLDRNQFLSDRERKALRLKVYQAEATSLPGEIDTTRATLTKAEAEGNSASASFFRSKLERLQDRMKTGNPADLAANQSVSNLHDFQEGIIKLQNSAKSLGQTLADSVGSAMSSISQNLADVILQTKSWGAALANIGSTVLQSIVKGLVDIVVQEVLLANLRKIFRKQDDNDTKQSLAGKVLEGGFKSIAQLGPIFGPIAFAAAIAGILALTRGFAAGGYTGAGDRLDPAGFVHRGEVVFSQADIARHGGVAAVEALRISGGMSGRGAGVSASPSAGGVGGPAMGDGQAPVNIAYFNTRQDAETWLGSQRGTRVLKDWMRDNRYDT